MPDFDVEAFVAELEGLGVKLTAVPLADGKMRINRWRLLHAVDAAQIEYLWASQIGTNQARIDVLASHLAGAAVKGTATGAAAIRPAVPTGAGDAKTRDRPNLAASSAAPIRPAVAVAPGDAKTKDRLEASRNAVPVRPPVRTGETDAKPKDRLGRPNSVGASQPVIAPSERPTGARRAQ